MMQKKSPQDNISIKGRIWQQWPHSQSEDHLLNIARVLKQPVTLVKMMNQIGLNDAEDMKQFLHVNMPPVLERVLDIPHMHKCLTRLKQAILQQEKIQIVSDYDVDGISSAALLIRYLKSWGCEVHTHIPDRFHEGYGPNEKLVEDINRKDVDLVVVLDSGSNVECLDDLNMDVVIVDHHIISTPPQKPILINGQLIADKKTDLLNCADLCTTGLLFLILCHLQQDPQIDQHPQSQLVKDNMSKVTIVVCLATICDMVPLTAINRAIVRRLLAQLRTATEVLPGIDVLLQCMGKDMRSCAAEDFAFSIGPVVNAASRMTGKADLALELFLEDDYTTLQQLAERLLQLNQERKDIEMQTYQEAEEIIGSKYAQELPSCLLLYQEDWHLGVVGIVAGRIAQKFNRPVLVLTKNQNVWKGSGRSVQGVDLNHCLQELQQHCPSLTGGGHEMAVGLSVSAEDLSAMKFYLPRIVETSSPADKQPMISHFNEEFANVSGLHLDFLNHINLLSPFGTANPAPRFLLSHVRVVKRLAFRSLSRFNFYDQYDHAFSAIVFHHKCQDVDAYLYDNGVYDLLVRISINNYQNQRRLQIIIDDARPCS